MIPINYKKKTLEVTVDEMTNFALNYVEKFAPSKQQLRTYLLKKYLTSRTPNIKKNDVSNLIPFPKKFFSLTPPVIDVPLVPVPAPAIISPVGISSTKMSITFI